MESPSRLTGHCGETLAVASAPLSPPEGNGDWGGFRQLPAPFGKPASGAVFHTSKFQSGVFWRLSHHLGLGQQLPADACVDIFFLSRFNPHLS